MFTMTNDQRFKVGDTIFVVSIDEDAEITCESCLVNKIKFVPTETRPSVGNNGNMEHFVTQYNTLYFTSLGEFWGIKPDDINDQNPALFATVNEAMKFLDELKIHPYKRVRKTPIR